MELVSCCMCTMKLKVKDLAHHVKSMNLNIKKKPIGVTDTGMHTNSFKILYYKVWVDYDLFPCTFPGCMFLNIYNRINTSHLIFTILI